MAKIIDRVCLSVNDRMHHRVITHVRNQVNGVSLKAYMQVYGQGDARVSRRVRSVSAQVRAQASQVNDRVISRVREALKQQGVTESNG